MNSSSAIAPASISRWPHRLALATVLAAIPLLLMGGTVTTIEAGMSIDGWLVLEPGRGDHFLLFYPLEKWFRDDGTFSEHTHRLFGALVGMLSIATVVAALRSAVGGRARLWSTIGLVAVSAQGVLGGFRVLENSPELAFLHGVFAQIVFAILVAAAVMLSPRYRAATSAPCTTATSLRRASLATVAVTFITIFAGAWLRHSSSHPLLGIHILGVIGTAAMAFKLAGRLRRASEIEDGHDRKPLRGSAKRIHALLGTQIALGFGAFWIVFMVVGTDVPEIHQSILPTLHVLVGALVLGQLVAASMWAHRLLAPQPTELAPTEPKASEGPA